MLLFIHSMWFSSPPYLNLIITFYFQEFKISKNLEY